MGGRDQRLVAWVSTQVMPHEPAVRAWLKRSMVSAEDADDLIQEAYANLASLDAFEQIARPDGYFFQIVRNLLTTQIRRARIVRIESVAEIDTLVAGSEDPSPERVTGARRELEMVQRLIAGLPDRCRRIFEMRKIEGLSQREIAERLKVTESIVENDGVKGMRLIMQAMRATGEPAFTGKKANDERPAKRS
ncbi:RNA polymerase sigma factor [Sphingomonas colocasiae]|uniref:Sigma-70 family RNA polymerase sigma factor n=1 Tax=Sphingomonas colocasiae TaxID=1848973 RepID=A0ABS7PRL7_9SPHN|nr:sigma-70 family RNA polymerase sigma factor [Sphingomonas colocasiae]MBY8823988.1 sigma-70 family RNA polymerase sigma factor [Sphingomonas colocasiae]